MQYVKGYGTLTEDEQNKALAEIQQAFAGHCGRITSSEDVEPIEALLAELADVNEISSVAAGAGFALVSALPVATEGAPAWRIASRWRATVCATEFVRHQEKISELTGSADDDNETIFDQCLASLQSLKQELIGCTSSSTDPNTGSFLKNVLGNDTQHLGTAVEAVEKWVRQRVQKQSTGKREALNRAIEKLEDIAGGKSPGGSWKEKLGASSTWDEVQHEAGYHLIVKVDETTSRPLHEVLDDVFGRSRQHGASMRKRARTCLGPRSQAQHCQMGCFQ
jgi:hypothetical protein